MASPRRIGATSSKTRATLLDATQELMLSEGYAAVSSRRVAAAAGVKPALIHYYFPTMDDLFLALLRRGAERNLERVARALESPSPLRALWEFDLDPAGTALLAEFTALANHRPAVLAETAAYAERFRALQLRTITEVLAGTDVGDAIPPVVLAVLMTSLSQILVMEEALGVSTGHAESLEFVDRLLERIEGPVGSSAINEVV